MNEDMNEDAALPHCPSPQKDGWRHFALGVGVTLSVLALMHVTTCAFDSRHGSRSPIVTGARDIDQIMFTDPILFWQPARNQVDREVTETLACDEEGRTSTYEFNTNAHGFRGPELLPRGEQYRVLALGDSTTFGQHLNDEETWPEQLQQLLDPERGSVEIINAGVIGASSFQGLAFLATRGLEIAPDLVLVTYGFNDWAVADVSDRDRARLNRQRGIRGMIERLFRPLPTGPVQRATPGEYLDNLFAMQKVCADFGMDLAFILWPNPHELETPGTGASHTRALMLEVCRATDAHCIDLLLAFTAAAEPLYVDCIHGSAAGCRLTAEILAAFIRENMP